MFPEEVDAIEKRAAHWYNECDACRAKIPMYETAGWHSSAEGWCEEPTPCETQIAADLRALPAEVRRLRAALEKIAKGLVGQTPDSALESKEALTSFMWMFSQEVARAALGEVTT